jgi:CPA1 family monovalent cation:H+ antiporter
MHEDTTLSIVIIVVELLFMASLAAVVSKKLRFPFTIGLVILGLLIGLVSKNISVLQPLSALRLTPDVVLFVFLPVLLFEAAYSLDARSLLKNIFAIYMLAVPALLISTAIAGFLVHYFLGMPVWVALLFGALISATDPAAVVALFKEMGAPKRLHLLVEGESLFNDGTALVVFRIILGIVMAGTLSASTLAGGAIDFILTALGGSMVGVIMGVLFSWTIGKIWNNPLVEITLSVVLAHSSFIIAEHLLHVSGVIATVVAGLTLGSYGRSKISPQVSGHMESFWEYLAFICNSLIFLLVGLSIDLTIFFENIWAILLGTLFVLVARAIAVYTVFPVVEWLKLTERVSKAFQTVIFWGGLRGALAIVMVLSIPETLPIKSYLLALTFGIVLTNLLINGLTVKPLMSMLGLIQYSLKERLERSQAMLEAIEETSEKVTPFSAREGIDIGIALKIKKSYDSSIAAIEDELKSFREKIGREDESDMVLGHCLLMEKSHYESRFKQGMLGEDNFKDLQIDIDRQLDRLKEEKEVYVEAPPSVLDRIDTFMKIPFWGTVFRRGKDEMLKSLYERERVRLNVNTLILKELNKLKKHKVITEAVAEKSEKIYSRIRQRTVSRMEVVWMEKPEIVDSVEKKLLERFCLNSELEAYQELYSKGSIAEKILMEMEEDISRRLRKT